MPSNNEERSFQFFAPAEFEKAKNGEWRIRGVASTEDLDLQGEIIKQNGLDISPLKDGKGLFNWDHEKGPENILGVIDVADMKPEGLYVEGYLLKNSQKAKAVYNILESFKPTEKKRLGFSVEGKVLRRSGADGKVIQAAKIDKVALTLDPVNPYTYSELVKSLTNDYERLETLERTEQIEDLDSEIALLAEFIMEDDDIINETQAISSEFIITKGENASSHKYVKRTGAKGSYKYWYKLPNGHVVSSDKEEGPPRVDHDTTVDHDRLDFLKQDNKKLIDGINNWDGQNVGKLKEKIGSLHEVLDEENVIPSEVGVNLKAIKDEHLSAKQKRQLKAVKDYPVWAMDADGNCLIGRNMDEVAPIDDVIDGLKEYDDDGEEITKPKPKKDDKAEKSLAAGDYNVAPTERKDGTALQVEGKKKKKKLSEKDKECLKSALVKITNEYLAKLLEN